MPTMYTKRIAQALFYTFILVQAGCSPSSVTPVTEEKMTTLNSVNEFEDLSLLDSTLMKNQIRELSDDDSEEYDLEAQVELLSRKDKIILVGDSWAVFPCLYNSMTKMIREQEIDLNNDSRCMRTSKLGVLARDWIGSKQDERTIRFLKNTPKIKYMYLSLGGNDLMGTWNKKFTAAQEQQLFDQTYKIIQQVIKNYLAVSPNLKIILSGYDIPHFKPNHKISLYRNIFERMGSPSDLQINQALVAFTKYVARVSNGKNVFFINHIGLAQYYDGIPEDKFPAKQTLKPDLISPFNNPGAVGGNINYHSSERSMIDWLYLISDAFHLNHKNYLNVMNHTYHNVLSNIMPN